MDISDELDRSFGSGPAHRPVEDRLVAGRRRVRRRRATSALAVVATVGVLGMTYAVAGGAMPATDAPLVNQPSGPETDIDQSDPSRPDPLTEPPDGTTLTEVRHVRFVDDDSEVLAPLDGATIVRQIGGVDLGPRFAGPDDRTAAASVVYRGDRLFVLVRDLNDTVTPDYLAAVPPKSRPRLEDFLDRVRRDFAVPGPGSR